MQSGKTASRLSEEDCVLERECIAEQTEGKADRRKKGKRRRWGCGWNRGEGRGCDCQDEEMILLDPAPMTEKAKE